MLSGNTWHMTGTKKGCDHGQYGACTVLVNNQRINACLSLVLQHQGDTIMIIEGLGTPDRLHPMQAAFIKHDGYQSRPVHPVMSAPVCWMHIPVNDYPQYAGKRILRQLYS